MKKYWLALFALCLSHAYSAEPGNQVEENLLLRRIAEYWKEGELTLVKTHISSFLQEYPESLHIDSLYAMLGDIYFKEKNYSEALKAYDSIATEPFLQKTQFNHLFCLHDQEVFDDAVTCAEAFLQTGNGSKTEQNIARFQMANSLFRLGKVTDHPDAKAELYNRALANFKVLASTDYAEQALYPSAVIYTYLKENARAAALYESLAGKHPDQKEAFLFQAATLLLDVDKDAAIEIYGKIYPLNGSLAANAAFNQIQLLFEQKRYKDLLLTQEKALKYIPLERLNTLRYYIGKSLMALEDYQHAVAHLIQFTESESPESPLTKNAHLSLLTCARQIHDMPLFERSLKNLLVLFPNDKETAQALLLHAHLCKESHDFDKAQEDLQILATRFSDHPEHESFLYDYALILSQTRQWAEGEEAFKDFLVAYPASSKKVSAYRHLITCQMEEGKLASAETLQIKRKKLVETLVISLGEKEIFSPDEKKRMRFLLAKTMYEMGQYKDAVVELEDFIRDFPNDTSSGQAHLLAAYCYAHDTSTSELFAHHAEKALTLSSDTPKSMHLQLYNAYLTLAELAPAEEKPSFVDQSADHLFAALDLPIKEKNRFWLANHYFQRYQNCSEEKKAFYLERSIAVMENLLGLHGNGYNLAISKENLEVEAEVIKLGQLYSQANRPADAIGVLSSLKKEQAAHPDFNWKYQRLALFELGATYEQIKDFDEAIKAYDVLIGTATHAHSYFGVAAKLKKTRLEYVLLTPQQKLEKSGKLQSICDSLKDLEIQRRLVTEPWHIEAALTYLDIKVALAPENEKLVAQQQLVSQILENFASDQNPTAQRYLSSAEQFPQQFAIYQQYMQFLNAERARLGALLEQNPEMRYLGKAEEQYKALMQQPMHDLLQARVQQRLEELKTL